MKKLKSPLALVTALIFLIHISGTTVATAESSPCLAPVQPIHQGQAANCSGFLFSYDAEKTAAQARDDASYYKKLSDKLEEKSKLEEDQSKILTERLKLYMDASDTLSKTIAQKDNTETIYRFAYFAVGVLVTGAIAVNLRK